MRGIDEIVQVHKHKPTTITDDIENNIVEILGKKSRKDYDGLPFSTWSLRVLAGGFIFRVYTLWIA